MDARINLAKLNPGAYKVMFGFGEYLAKSRLDKKLLYGLRFDDAPACSSRHDSREHSTRSSKAGTCNREPSGRAGRERRPRPEERAGS